MDTLAGNKRKSDRIVFGNARVGISRAQSLFCDAKKPATLPVIDISKNGLQVLAESYVMRGSKCDLQINIPEINANLVCRAKVMWVKKEKGNEERYRIGFRFIRLKLGDAKKLKLALEKFI